MALEGGGGGTAPRDGGGAGTGPRLGGGGGALGCREPENGGGTLKPGLELSSSGSFGGRGGGGGPGLASAAPDEALDRPDGCIAGPSLTAN